MYLDGKEIIQKKKIKGFTLESIYYSNEQWIKDATIKNKKFFFLIISLKNSFQRQQQQLLILHQCRIKYFNMVNGQ